MLSTNHGHDFRLPASALEGMAIRKTRKVHVLHGVWYTVDRPFLTETRFVDRLAGLQEAGTIHQLKLTIPAMHSTATSWEGRICPAKLPSPKTKSSHMRIRAIYEAEFDSSFFEESAGI